ncbi:MAG: 2Fe-2S iron-sulfur cluster-binding protein [Bdellovibrionales bacterium]
MKIKFMPQNIVVDADPNKSVLDIASANDVYIKSVCKGVPSCAECRVRVTEGEYNVFPPAAKEINLIGSAYFVDQRRLSCQLRCYGDVTIDLTEQMEKQNTLTKRPRGSKEEAAATQARTGNIIFEAVEQKDRMAREDTKRIQAERALEKEEQKRELERIRARRKQQQGGPQKPDDED